MDQDPQIKAVTNDKNACVVLNTMSMSRQQTDKQLIKHRSM